MKESEYFIVGNLINIPMNALDKNRKGVTAWCEECGEVFDLELLANLHRDKTKHKIRVTEFWVTGRR